jgi:hypothetical protein
MRRLDFCAMEGLKKTVDAYLRLGKQDVENYILPCGLRVSARCAPEGMPRSGKYFRRSIDPAS